MLNFLMWFKQRAEGPQTPEAARPERAEAPSPGQRPGYMMILTTSPCKGKSFDYVKLLPLQGDIFVCMLTQGVTLG